MVRTLTLGFDLFKTGDNAYLDNDELTLRYRIWEDSSELSQSVRCYASTNIKAFKISHMWKLNKTFGESDNQDILKPNHIAGINLSKMFPFTTSSHIYIKHSDIYVSIQQA